MLVELRLGKPIHGMLERIKATSRLVRRKLRNGRESDRKTQRGPYSLSPKPSEGSLSSSDRPGTLTEGSQPERMAEWTGRREVKEQLDLLNSHRPARKPCSPRQEGISLGAFGSQQESLLPHGAGQAAEPQGNCHLSCGRRLEVQTGSAAAVKLWATPYSVKDGLRRHQM